MNATAHGMIGPPNASAAELSSYESAKQGETSIRTMFLRAINTAKRSLTGCACNCGPST